MRQKAFAFLCLMTALAPARGAGAMELRFPFPVAAVEILPAGIGRYDLPVGPWDGTGLPVQVFEGQLDRRAYRLEAEGKSLTEVIVPLRDQLVAAGYTIALDCEARACGGFDFRFRTEVMPEPGMHVDLADFRFVAAIRDGEAVSLLVSRSGGAAFVQVFRLGTAGLPVDGPGGLDAPEAPPIEAPVAPSVEGLAGDIAMRLDAGLPVAMDDLIFASGAAALEAGDYASLVAVAEWLKADPARKVMLVGHTDASGGLEANIALSKRRAEAVRQALMVLHDVPPAQVSAEGAGPLSPRATNATEEGRRKNRRVEAIAAST